MSENFDSASPSRTQGRCTWAVIFRHPERTDPTPGKEGLRVRQSLKTDNEQEAATMRDQMNALLASPQLRDLGAREQALGLFDPRVVDIFFYKLEGGETDFLALLDGVIAFPSSQSSDYRRALFPAPQGPETQRSCDSSWAPTRQKSRSLRHRRPRPRFTKPK